MTKKEEIKQFKSESRMGLSYWLLGTCFTFFTFVIAINPDLFKNNIFLAAQLTLAIPLFITSIFARSKLVYTKHFKKWDKYGFISFIFAYTFLINVIGILLSTLINLKIGLLFFGVNIFADLLYSYMDISDKKSELKSLFYKDIFFIVILTLGGILPSLGIY